VFDLKEMGLLPLVPSVRSRRTPRASPACLSALDRPDRAVLTGPGRGVRVRRQLSDAIALCAEGSRPERVPSGRAAAAAPDVASFVCFGQRAPAGLAVIPLTQHAVATHVRNVMGRGGGGGGGAAFAGPGAARAVLVLGFLGSLDTGFALRDDTGAIALVLCRPRRCSGSEHPEDLHHLLVDNFWNLPRKI